MDDKWYSIANIAEIPSPSILVYPDRIEENLQRMIRLAGGAQRLRPHVKTHKMPQVIALKIKCGISKFKVSTIAEAEMTAAAGGQDILLAYQPVGPNGSRLARLITTFPAAQFSTIVDNLATAEELSRIARDRDITFRLYVDLDVGFHRTGIAPDDRAFELYQAITRTKGLQAMGLHAYDGHLHHPEHGELERAVVSAFDPVWKLRDKIIAAGLHAPKIVASGTPTFPILSRHEDVEVGCGTTVLWDFGQAKVCPDLQFVNAALLITRVISRPASDRLCFDLGHKAVASEMQPPRVSLIGLEDAEPVVHSEEHLVMRTDRATEYSPGQVFYAIPRHICPTIALHQEAWVVHNGIATETWPIVARARRITI